MSNEHAMRFPFVGSAMLLSLFLLFKFLSKDLVNAVLTCYFFVLGIVALSYVLLVWPYFIFLRLYTLIGNLFYLFASLSQILLLVCTGQLCYLLLNASCRSVGMRTLLYGDFHISVVCDCQLFLNFK